MAAIMASTYKAYLGVGLGPLSVGICDDHSVMSNQNEASLL